MKLVKNIGFLLLAIYLIIIGLSGLAPSIMMNIPSIAMSILALVAGIFILIGR